MKKTLRIAIILLGNLTILFLLVEIAGLAVHFRNEGTLFYTRPAEERPAELEEEAERLYSEYRLQPYWGYSTKLNRRSPGGKSTNNYGFRSNVDFPAARGHSREVIVGVFGGSVGAHFTTSGSERLEEVLTADPRFAGRDVVVLNFAGGGYKQPQQLQILTYFLSQGQELDLVINIDGFNEVALTPFNRGKGIALSMPSSLHVSPLVNLLDHSTLTPERLESLHRIASLKDRRIAVTTWLHETHSAAVHLVLGVWNRHLEATCSNEVNRFQGLETEGTAASLMGIAALEEPVTDAETMFEFITERWANASLLMHQLLSVRGIPYYHYLQPNQYFTERVFSEEEKAIAIRADAPLRGHAARGYPHLLAFGPWLISEGIRFHDATGIFDDEPAMVYVDDCCHYNQLGNELLAEFIAERILESWPEM